MGEGQGAGYLACLMSPGTVLLLLNLAEMLDLAWPNVCSAVVLLLLLLLPGSAGSATLLTPRLAWPLITRQFCLTLPLLLSSPSTQGRAQRGEGL